MANKKFTDLPAATVPLSGTEIFALVQSGDSKKVAASDLPGVTSVSATAPVTSSGGKTPTVALDLGAGASLAVASNKLVRAALTGDVTASQDANSTTIANNAVTDAKFRQSAGVSVVGRSANSTGNVADIAASADGQVLKRSSGSLAFGAVGLATDVTGTLPVANGGTGAAALTANGALVSNSGGTAVSAVAPGTSGNVLTSNGTQWVSSAIAQSQVTNLTSDLALKANTADVAVPIEAAGSTYALVGAYKPFRPFVLTSNATLGNNYFEGYDCVFGKNRNISTFVIWVSATVANAVARVCIYNTSPTTGYPTTLVGYSNEFDCSTATGLITAGVAGGGTLAVQGSKVYHVALISNVAAPNVMFFSSYGPSCLIGASTPGNPRIGLIAAQTYTTPPAANYPAGASASNYFHAPIMAWSE